MDNKIVIGDVHGHYETLMGLMSQLPHDNVVFCGDLIDRGPNSCEVVQFVKNNGYDCVRGNHEQFMIDYNGTIYEPPAIYTTTMLNIWGTQGGLETIDSYNGKRELIKEHIEWMKGLPFYKKYDNIKNDKDECLLVSHSIAYHAFKKQRIINEDQFGDIIMWNRDFHNIKPMKGIYNIFGHTPQQNEAKVRSFYSCVDTGAFSDRQGYGRLTGLEFPSMKLYEQERID